MGFRKFNPGVGGDGRNTRGRVLYYFRTFSSVRSGTTFRTDQRIELPDGRKLGYDEHGPPDGTPLLYFHGTPSPRRELRLFVNEELTDRFNARVIDLDRPGMGLSDFQAGRTVGDWPADVAALADALGLERFAVLGYSGGGPYALACALKFPIASPLWAPLAPRLPTTFPASQTA